MKKRSNAVRSQLVMIAATITMILGCQKEMLDFKEPGKNNLSIQEAQKHYQANNLGNISKQARASGDDSTGQRPKPAWGRAHNRGSSHGEAVVVPLEDKQRKILVSGGDRTFEYDQMHYLFMYKNAKKEVQTEHVTLMPSDEWVNGDQKVFTGRILVDSWDKKDRRIYSFSKDGAATSEQIVGPSSAKPGKDNKNGRTTMIIYRVCMTTVQTCGGTQISTGPYTINPGQNSGECATTVCKDFPVTEEDPWNGVTGTAGTGGNGTSLKGFFHNYAGWNYGSGDSGDNYLPTCNPSIPPGTPVGPNELPPCQTLTPVNTNTTPGGIGINFAHPSPEPYIFFEEGDPEALWFTAHQMFDPLVPLHLPSYSSFYAAYPKNPNNTAADLPAADVYNLIGGTVKQLKIDEPRKYINACALRVSRALNYCAAGHAIPQSTWTVKGADGKNYFLSAAKLYAYLMIRYKNAPKTVLTTADGGDFGVLFQGKLQPKKGLYIMEPINKGEYGYQASGHATVFTGLNCVGGCEFTPDNDADKKHGVKQITLFEMN